MYFQRTIKFAARAALIMLMTLLGVSFAGAQQTTPAPATEVEFVGLVEAMTLDTLTVNRQVIDVSNAEFTIAVSLGIPVKIEGTLLPDGSIVAREVIAPEAIGSILPGEFEIVGLLMSIDGDNFIIGQVSVDASTAEIKPGVAAGSLVKAHVSQNEDGSLLVREIELLEDSAADDNTNLNANDNVAGANDNNANDNSMFVSGDEVEIVGTLTGMTADPVIVSGQTISIADAEIKDTLILGALVKVHLSSVDGQLVAREIELARTQSQDRDRDNNDNANENENDNSAAVPPGCVPTQPAGWTTYTVRAGDTLSGIAAATGANLRNLAQINCIANASQIRVGQPLFVPRAPTGNTGVGNVNVNLNSNVNSNDNQADDGNTNLNSNDNSDDSSSNDNSSNDNVQNDNDDNGGSNDNDDD